VPPLTPPQAHSFHIACIESTARLAASLPRSLEKWLYLTSGPAAGSRLRLSSSIRIGRQRGSDLGRRLERTFRERQRAGAERVVVIGSDSPILSPRRLRQSFSSLARAQAVLGPARDGGFYLIGLALPDLKLRGLFDAVDWGGPRAFRQMRARLRAAGLRVAQLPESYDVDTKKELARLARDLRRSRGPHLAPLRAWFRRFKSS
ncbi:MAG: TIGR04282 family arsenosugar biosynthesis glycosyltransferase, partial [Candidatus Acidiferrales bacterium]